MLRVYELFGETIRTMFGCGCYFVAECYESVQCEWRCSAGQTAHGPPNNVRVVRVVHVIPVLFMFLYVGSYLLL